jgi:hypothetical protein
MVTEVPGTSTQKRAHKRKDDPPQSQKRAREKSQDGLYHIKDIESDIIKYCARTYVLIG